MKKKYIVRWKRLVEHTVEREIEAENASEAIDKAREYELGAPEKESQGQVIEETNWRVVSRGVL